MEEAFVSNLKIGVSKPKDCMNFKDDLKNKVAVFQQNVSYELENLQQSAENDIDIQIIRYIGMQDALERFARQIDHIQEDRILLVPPESATIGYTQYLTIDDKFLNAAYCIAMDIKDNPRGMNGSVASHPEGEKGKETIMNQIMDYIQSLC